MGLSSQPPPGGSSAGNQASARGTVECPSCGKPSESGARFCMHCGASTTPMVHCPTCNQLQPTGTRFCMSCGSAMAGATFHGGLADGAVIEGVWQRSSDEFIRRVEPDDCRTFLGNRIVRIPPGTVGVVVVSGKVERLLPSGEQTTVTLFDRVANFFSGKGGTTAFYLLDLRPIPIPFTVQTRASATGRSIQTQILTSFQIPRGDREAVGMFLTNVLGPRAGFSAGDLYSLLRPEVTRIAGLLLERLGQQGEVRTAETEAELRRILGEQLARRYGLVVDVDIAPLTSTASMSFQLGADTALHTEDGVAVEIDLVVRVQGQHEDFSPARLTPALQVATAARLRRLPMPQLSSSNGFVAIEEALRTDVARELASFGMQLVAINVLDVRSKTGVWLLGARAELVQAQEELGMRRALLAHSGAELDVEALALQQTLRKQEIERGAKLQGLASELESAKAEATLRANATFATDAAAIADRQRRVELQQNAAKLDTAAAKLAAERQLEIDAAARNLAQARRQNSQTDELDELRHRATKDAAAQAARANLTQKELELEAIKQRQQLALESERNRQQVKDSVDALREKNAAVFDDHQKRAALNQELADREEARQIEKLRAMAELDQKMAAQDQAHELKVHESLRGLSERQMIAMQAAKLAQGEGGGAAWAQVLVSGEAQKEKEQRLADELRHGAEVKDLLLKQASSVQGLMQAQLDRMEALAKQAMSATAEQQRSSGAAALYERSMDSMSRVAASRAEPTPVAAQVSVVPPATDGAASTQSCKSCSAPLRAGARFCAACGSAQTP